MLRERLECHGVDVEKLSRKVLENHLRKTQSTLTEHDYDDALAYLVATTWELSQRYNPDKGPAFSTYAWRLLSLRIVDWRREHHGRNKWTFSTHTHTRQLTQPLSLDHHHAADGTTLGDTLTATTGDPATDSNPDLIRALRAPSSDEAWNQNSDRPRLPRRTT